MTIFTRRAYPRMSATLRTRTNRPCFYTCGVIHSTLRSSPQHSAAARKTPADTLQDVLFNLFCLKNALYTATVADLAGRDEAEAGPGGANVTNTLF